MTCTCQITDYAAEALPRRGLGKFDPMLMQEEKHNAKAIADIDKTVAFSMRTVASHVLPWLIVFPQLETGTDLICIDEDIAGSAIDAFAICLAGRQLTIDQAAFLAQLWWHDINIGDDIHGEAATSRLVRLTANPHQAEGYIRAALTAFSLADTSCSASLSGRRGGSVEYIFGNAALVSSEFRALLFASPQIASVGTTPSPKSEAFRLQMLANIEHALSHTNRALH